MNKENSRPIYSGILYIGSYGAAEETTIHVCSFNGETGKISIIQHVNGVENASYLTVHPNGQHLYAASETATTGDSDGGSVVAFHIDEATGQLRASNSRSLTHGAHTCYISTDDKGQALFAANYTGGNVALIPLNAQGELAAEAIVQQHEGELGPNSSRQDAPHAHCIVPMPHSSFVCAADLGIDAIVIYRYDAKLNTITLHGKAEVQRGAGPRHIIFHPNLAVGYVMNELDSTITLLKADKELGTLEAGHTVSALPSGFNGYNDTADIHLDPSGRYLYGSNRGHNSIAVFAVDQESGELSLVQHIDCGGETPRNFVISPDGLHLLAANQKTGNVVVFSIDADSGMLIKTDSTLQLSSPVCLKFA